MAKKWIVIMLIVSMGLAGAVIYLKGQTDGQGPEIKYTKQAIQEYDSSMKDKELLEGVEAVDEKDGDVTDSLTIESIYEMDDSHVVVTYVAKDRSNNVTKFKRKLKTETSEEKDDDLEKVEGEEAEEEKADEELSAEPTPEVLDEAALAAQTQESAADAMPQQNPKIYLTEYYVKVSAGTSLDLLSYVKDIKDDKDLTNELWRRIQINGQVNTAVAGTYTCMFSVVDADGNASNNAELIVIVE